MKALSLRQPWAWLVAAGYKTIETRTWSSKYRGPLLIHASGKWDIVAQGDFITLKRNVPPDIQRALINAYTTGVLHVVGHIIALVDMQGCVNLTEVWEDEDIRGQTLCYFPIPLNESRYGFKLELKHRFDQPIPCRGALRLWTLPPKVTEAVRLSFEMFGYKEIKG